MSAEELAEADEYIHTHSVKDILHDLFVAYLLEGITLDKYIEMSEWVKSQVPKCNIN